MKLTTPVKLPKSDISISASSKIMTIGSCFSDHMGSKLVDARFDCLSNPYGTIFNPISISKLIDRSVSNTNFTTTDIDHHNQRHFSYDLHSSFDSDQVDIILKKANHAVENVHETINNLDLLIITFGTSIGYHLLDSDALVANCHKVPNHNFERRFLDDELMFSSMCAAIDLLREQKPALDIIFTVSPVRHTKEGLIENNLSKSKLIVLSHRLAGVYARSSYFPSYEIMTDELRDYRFYTEDMIHPSSQAVDIIWNHFMNSFFDKSAVNKVDDLRKLVQAFNHRPFDLRSEGHIAFCKKQLIEINNLKEKYPEVNFDVFELHFARSI